MNIFNMPIYTDPNFCTIRYCYPKTKKKRIRNKWRKYRYKRIPREDALIFSKGILCHPTMAEQLKSFMKSAIEHNYKENGITPCESPV